MSITTLTPVEKPVPSPEASAQRSATELAPVVALDERRRPASQDPEAPGPAASEEWHLGEAGAASAEYAAVTACGVGLAGVLLKLLTSDFGQNLLKTLIEFFLKMVGIG